MRMKRVKKYLQFLTELYVLSDPLIHLNRYLTSAALKQIKFPKSLFFDIAEWNGQQNPLTLLSL